MRPNFVQTARTADAIENRRPWAIRWRVQGAFLSTALAIMGTWVPSAYGQAPPPAQRAGVYSRYEQQEIDEQLATLGAARDPRPEGKIIDRIAVVPLDVIEPRDPVPPRWLNVFHRTTRQYVIRREMLLEEGSLYKQVLVDETIRNLRRLPELSLIVVVGAVASAPNHVNVVVITKDVWSLRASWNVVANGGGIEQLLLAPTETNLFGTHQTVRGTFILEPAAYTFGLGYTLPRIADSRIAAIASADVMVNRASGNMEGTYGSVVAGQPIVSGLSEWAWDATVAWQDAIIRHYVNAQPSVYLDPTTHERVPNEYRSRLSNIVYEVTRSMGWENKHDLTFAANLSRSAYTLSFPGAAAETLADYRAAYVPLADTRVGPSVQYHSYTKRYVRVIDLDSLALQEDVRLGHDIVLAVAPSFRGLGASRDVLSLRAAAQYSAALRDGVMRLSLSSVTEPELSRPGAPIADASITPSVYLATPSILKVGRIVLDGTLVYRWRNYLNQTTFLGGDDRLRGFPTSFFLGKDWFAYNVELRSRPVAILTCQVAGVAFYDVGEAFNGFAHFEPFESVGVGLRALFHQLDRIVFRADIGFPVKRLIDPSTGEPIPPFGFLVSFGQAFDVPSVSPAAVLPTGQ